MGAITLGAILAPAMKKNAVTGGPPSKVAIRPHLLAARHVPSNIAAAIWDADTSEM